MALLISNKGSHIVGHSLQETCGQQLRNLGCEISESQVAKIEKIAMQFKLVKEPFYNHSKASDEELKAFKIQLFKRDNQLKIFIDPKLERKTGSYKVFSKVYAITFSLDNPSNATVSSKARLTLNLNKLASNQGKLARAIQNFKKEIKFLRKAKEKNLPHICQIEESECYQSFKTHTEKVVMYQPLYAGDLQERIEAKDLNDPETLKKIFKQCFSGLFAMHDLGYLHPDIKPLNIFLDEEYNAYIGDHGFTTKTTKWATVAKSGTPTYCSPEKFFLKDFPVTEAADVWAMGCALAPLVFSSIPIWMPLQKILWLLKHILPTLNSFNLMKTKEVPHIDFNQAPTFKRILSQNEQDLNELFILLHNLPTTYEFNLSHDNSEILENLYATSEALFFISRMPRNLENEKFFSNPGNDPLIDKENQFLKAHQNQLKLFLYFKFYDILKHLKKHTKKSLKSIWEKYAQPTPSTDDTSLQQLIKKTLMTDPQKRISAQQALELLS